MRVIPTSIHGIMDYLIGVVLIIAPWVFGFAAGGAETWVPVILGIGVILYSLMTAYEYGLVPAISMPAHLGLDAAGGLLLLVSPWLFQFADLIWWPHVLIGILEIGAAAMTQTAPNYLPQHEQHHHDQRTPTA